MNLAVVIDAMTTALALYVAALSRRFSSAPGWRDQRWFSLTALWVAAYSACNIINVANPSPLVAVSGARAQVLFAALLVTCWMRYTSAFLGAERSRLERWTERVTIAFGASALVPGLAFRDRVTPRVFEALGIVYHEPEVTPLGEAILAGLLAILAALTVRYARAWRRGVAHAGTHLGAFLVLLAMTVNDVLNATRVISTAYILDIAFVVPIGVVGYVLTARFAADARALADLRRRLESLVETRTAQLARAHEALHRSEKLAALGRFAAGVAHEVNNPAAAIAANLQYLEGELAAGSLPPDALECVRESRSATARVARIVRQLLDSGRLAVEGADSGSVALAVVARESLSLARARCPDHVELVSRVPEGLFARGQDSMVVQVLVNLVVNGAQAVPEGRRGTVVVSAERDGSRVRLTVEDDGAGMAPEVLARVFEPFFSTKPFGVGTGLGLAVSRGLVVSHGGDLHLESTPGEGTLAVITLPAADAPPAAAPAPTRDRPLDGRQLLVVDDDPAVLSSLRRLLDGRFDVECASGVAEGLALAAQGRFDLVLCDVMMPDGGGERLYRELATRLPEQAARLAFLTGGATTDAARAFLGAQPQPVIEKPIDVAALEEIAARVAANGAGGGRTSRQERVGSASS